MHTSDCKIRQGGHLQLKASKKARLVLLSQTHRFRWQVHTYDDQSEIESALHARSPRCWGADLLTGCLALVSVATLTAHRSCQQPLIEL